MKFGSAWWNPWKYIGWNAHLNITCYRYKAIPSYTPTISSCTPTIRENDSNVLHHCAHRDVTTIITAVVDKEKDERIWHEKNKMWKKKLVFKSSF